MVLLSLVGSCSGQRAPDSSVSATTTTTPKNVLVTVPDVRSFSLGEAVDIMAEVGLVGVPNDTDSHDEESVVRAQEPPAGAEVPSGSVVGFRTLTFGKRMCDTRVFPVGEEGTFDVVAVGPLTFYGLKAQMDGAESAFEPDSNGLREAVKIGVQVTGSADSVLVALPSVSPGAGGCHCCTTCQLFSAVQAPRAVDAKSGPPKSLTVSTQMGTASAWRSSGRAS